MKKILVSLFVFSFLFINVQLVNAEDTPTKSFKVIYPSGGESYKTGDKITIKWESTGYSPDSRVAFDLGIRRPDGSTGNTFLMNVTNLENDGSEIIVIPDNIETRDDYALMSTIFESSTKWQMARMGTFTITNSADITEDTRSITLLSPNGGESYKAGDKITVKWNSEGMSASEDLLIQILKPGNFNDGGGWDTLVSSTLNDGSHVVALGSNLVSGDYKIAVKGDYVNDISEDYFTIVNEKPSVPTISHLKASNITSISARLSASVEYDDSVRILDQGICYDSGENQRFQGFLSNCVSSDNNNLLEVDIDGLSSNTKYYFRGYSKSSVGIGYSEIKMFTTKKIGYSESGISINKKTKTNTDPSITVLSPNGGGDL